MIFNIIIPGPTQVTFSPDTMSWLYQRQNKARFKIGNGE